jgi:hypothetical protein
MAKLLVRTAYINGMHWADGDGVCPLWNDAERTYTNAQKFLEKHGKPILDQQVNPFPWEGVISAPAAVSCYSFLECIVGNHFRPYGGGVQHRMIVGGREEDYQRITHVINILHYESGWFRWPNSYLHVEEDRVIDFPLDTEDIVQALPYASRLLT